MLAVLWCSEVFIDLRLSAKSWSAVALSMCRCRHKVQSSWDPTKDRKHSSVVTPRSMCFGSHAEQAGSFRSYSQGMIVGSSSDLIERLLQSLSLIPEQIATTLYYFTIEGTLRVTTSSGSDCRMNLTMETSCGHRHRQPRIFLDNLQMVTPLEKRLDEVGVAPRRVARATGRR